MGLSEVEGIRLRRPPGAGDSRPSAGPPAWAPGPPAPVSAWVRVLLCVLFLAFSASAWWALPAVLYYVLFFIPSYACGEYVSAKLFGEEFGRSISEKEFSVARILVGVVMTLLLLCVIHGLAALLRL